MKSIILGMLFGLIIALLTYTEVYSQTATDRGAEFYRLFKGTTTLIVLDEGDSSLYNDLMKEAIEKYWTISPYEFIRQTQLYSYLNKSDYSLLVKNSTERTIKKVRGTSVIRNNEIGLFVSGRGAMDLYVANDAVAFIKFEDVLKVDQYAYKLKGLVRAMHNYVTDFLAMKEIDRHNREKEENIFLNQHNPQLRDHTLYINKEDMPSSLQKTENIEKRYKFPVKLVNENEIREAIDQEKKGIAFLHLHPRVKLIQVIRTEDGHFLYSGSSAKYNQFIGRDLAAISKAAE